MTTDPSYNGSPWQPNNETQTVSQLLQLNTSYGSLVAGSLYSTNIKVSLQSLNTTPSLQVLPSSEIRSYCTCGKLAEFQCDVSVAALF